MRTLRRAALFAPLAWLAGCQIIAGLNDAVPKGSGTGGSATGSGGAATASSSTSSPASVTSATSSSSSSGSQGKPDGQSCTTNAACTSKNCVLGLCCNMVCNGTCEACDAKSTGSSDGVCGPVIDMRPCGPQICAVDMLTRSVCAPGGCMGTTVPCPTGYACQDQIECATSPCSAASCASGYSCDTTTGKCVQATADGGSCTGPSDCASGEGCCGPSGAKTCTSLSTTSNCHDCGNACTTSTLCQAAACNGIACAAVNANPGTMCSDSGGKVCNANGACVQCYVDGDCDISGAPAGKCSGGTCLPVTIATWPPAADGGATKQSGYGIAIDSASGYVYWATAAYVYSAPVSNINNGENQISAQLGQGWGVGVNNGTVFFDDRAGGDVAWRKTGSPVDLSTGEQFPQGLAVDMTNVYWVDSGTGSGMGTLNRCSQSGCADGGPRILVSGLHDPFAVAADGMNAYFTERATGTNGKVWAFSIAGGTANAFATGQSLPQGVAVDATNVYWANNGDGTIVMLPLITMMGTQPTTVLKIPSGYANFVAVDATYLYWTANGQGANSGTVTKCALANLPCVTPIVLASGLADPEAIAVDANAVYWVDSLTIKRIGK